MFYDEEIKEFPDGNFSQPGDEVISIQIIDNQNNAARKEIGYHSNSEPLLSNMKMGRNYPFENAYGRIYPVLENTPKLNWREGDSIFCNEPVTYLRRTERDYPKPEYSTQDEFSSSQFIHVDSFTRNGKSFSQGDFSRIQDIKKYDSSFRSSIQEFSSQDPSFSNVKSYTYENLYKNQELSERETITKPENYLEDDETCRDRDREFPKEIVLEKDKQYNNIHNTIMSRVVLKRSASDEETISTTVGKLELTSYENDNILDIADRGYLISESDTSRKSTSAAAGAGGGAGTAGELDNMDAQTRYHFVKYIKRDAKTIKLWECGICGREFQHHYTLTRHLPTHTDERNFHCSACGKSFRQMSTLSQHRATHSLERPYACEICNKNFNRVSTLISHRKTHSGHKPYKCHICNKGFHQKGNLRNHMFTHTNERPYRCNFCDKGFNQQSNLVCHKNKAHGVIHDMRTARTAPRLRRAPSQSLEDSTPAPDSSGLSAHSSSASEISSSICILNPSSISLDAPWWLQQDLQPDNTSSTAYPAGGTTVADIGKPVVIKVVAPEEKQSRGNVEFRASSRGRSPPPSVPRGRAPSPALHRPRRSHANDGAAARAEAAAFGRTLNVKATSSLLKSPMPNSARTKFVEAPPYLPPAHWAPPPPPPPPPRARTDPLLNHHQGGVGGLEAIVSLLASPVAGGFELGPNNIINNQYAHAHALTQAHAHAHTHSYTLDLFDHMDAEADGHHSMAPVGDEDSADDPHISSIINIE